jgi:hypothetical protein
LIGWQREGALCDDKIRVLVKTQQLVILNLEMILQYSLWLCVEKLS